MPTYVDPKNDWVQEELVGVDDQNIIANDIRHLHDWVGELGYADRKTNLAIGDNSAGEVTLLTFSVTIPGGGRNIKVTASGLVYTSTGSDMYRVVLYQDADVIYTARWIASTTTDPAREPFHIVRRVAAPSAGAHTYKVTAIPSPGAGGTLTLNADTNYPTFILVEGC